MTYDFLLRSSMNREILSAFQGRKSRKDLLTEEWVELGETFHDD